ncbi:bifunctional adenosylcobinamide kinase/adenosylcobinamide-phosphate guanylyltransferase [Pseudaestuariivita sp.]|uniref:bifunctional adenosylcobinamide kinase/adenosylcobinamide-phosphate guanylyltransferase n=1 Tax=Pseudaestuariivita sp. TaxID=2211669 RepID=UPI0040599963
MSKTILVTGGARSGKSRIAEELTLAMGRPAGYVATAEAYDDEMRARIATHLARRGGDWVTVEEPVELVAALEGDLPPVRLVDCLTLWLTNLILREVPWEPAADALALHLEETEADTVLVTNEVGLGIVPDNALARAFRDAQGLLNQRIAAVADEVYLAVSGLSMRVK